MKQRLLLFVALSGVLSVIPVNYAACQGSGSVAGSNGSGNAPPAPTPNGVEIEIGIASRIGGPQISNYQSTSGTLSLTNLGRATPQLLTGLGFSCDSTNQEPNRFCANSITNHAGVFVSVQFGSGSNSTITGYSVGGSYALFPNIRILAGFSFTPVSETSPGFQIAASQYVTKNPSLFPGINPADLASGAYGAFDGIQTTSTAPVAGSAPTAVIYYPGSVLETHYRGGFLVGFAFPINVFKLFSGSSN